ncbi:2-amino-4-hydroxy-6-hydroxymethyldihydropteridinepyrophosphokinase [Kingella potus]|uniref:2-amino-4-hydroxy-6-hydroxymethyldihydropteridine pyrophosphokinase n=1 Tax=Kingella potus TaxID=265175 RepID=A0A377R1T3_9NEIS|nr:2-amino-4-hydroxy-6-hydroxymethyldihydropteridine diphosphokinase [Kingella potus]UOP00235.1 2-amino-4-hydroxy-6-hydroxymethyldihydropteridine diphosphokinase [Kingella potus]STR02707.1 2-amino-4-hydroxy-6-hydroxymethyldihydropteridinepyrophosphokinase [Kingella potus]
MPHTRPATAAIAFGSNLGASADTIARAAAHLRAHPQILSLRLSPLYRTAPVGYADQPDFTNAAAIIETTLSARSLLALMQQTEQDFGRERPFPNAPRTLDLDLIDYAHTASDDPALTLPHPRAHLRAFVVRPLSDLDPAYPIGRHGTAGALAETLGTAGITRLEAV